MKTALRICTALACILVFLTICPAFAEDAQTYDDPPDVVDDSETLDAADPKAILVGNRFGPSWDGRENYRDGGENEFVIIGGDYLGENWKNTYYIGGAYFYHINDLIALGGQYFYSPIVVDKDTPFYQSLATSDTHTAVGLCMLNTPVAMRMDKRMFNMDFYFTLGAGAMRINRRWEPVGVIGGGTKFYFPVPWIALRLDINSYLHYTPMPGGKDFSGDVSLGGGISFLFPNRKRVED